VIERFLGITHVSNTIAAVLKITINTTVAVLKMTIESILSKHHLSINKLRRQGYDRASNMRGELNGFKTLILNDNSYAYYVHCFTHQFQLTLVAITKNHIQLQLFLVWLIVFLMLLEHHANVVMHFVKNKLLKLWKHYGIMKFLLVMI
jgi:hypothetical protein